MGCKKRIRSTNWPDRSEKDRIDLHVLRICNKNVSHRSSGYSGWWHEIVCLLLPSLRVFFVIMFMGFRVPAAQKESVKKILPSILMTAALAVICGFEAWFRSPYFNVQARWYLWLSGRQNVIENQHFFWHCFIYFLRNFFRSLQLCSYWIFRRSYWILSRGC